MVGTLTLCPPYGFARASRSALSFGATPRCPSRAAAARFPLLRRRDAARIRRPVVAQWPGSGARSRYRPCSTRPRAGRPGGEPTRVTCKTLSFAGPTGEPVRTGGPFRCCLGYQAWEPLDDVIVTVSLNWPSGYLCTQLSSPEGLRLAPGSGEIEFFCSKLTMQRGLYSVDVLIERRGEVLEWRPRCSLLRVGTGKIVAGDFYLEHRDRKSTRLNSSH